MRTWISQPVVPPPFAQASQIVLPEHGEVIDAL